MPAVKPTAVAIAAAAGVLVAGGVALGVAVTSGGSDKPVQQIEQVAADVSSSAAASSPAPASSSIASAVPAVPETPIATPSSTAPATHASSVSVAPKTSAAAPATTKKAAPKVSEPTDQPNPSDVGPGTVGEDGILRPPAGPPIIDPSTSKDYEVPPARTDTSPDASPSASN